MKLPALSGATVLLLTGCMSTSVLPPAGPAPLVYGHATDFTPLVEATSRSGNCVEPADAPLPSGGRAYAIRYAQPTVRQVTVTVDGAGRPTRYLDVRGDLSEADDAAGDRTTIGLFLDSDYAVLSNRQGSERPEFLEVPLDEVFASDDLGDPQGTMQQVLTRCGAV